MLRALHEAGVKIDIVAGHGVGAIGALFLALDGPSKLWEENGFWRAPGVSELYGWRTIPKVVGWALALAVAIVAVPIAVVALGLLLFPIDFLLKVIGLDGAPAPVSAYVRAVQALFAPEALPTWLPRLVFLVLGGAAVAALADGWSRDPRQPRGPFWWRAVQPPLSAALMNARCWRTVWDLLRGAVRLKEPVPTELAQRYIELVTENLGQPGFREVLIAAHDLDARRDLIFALVAEGRRRDLVRRPTTRATEARRAEITDLGGAGRRHLVDAVAGALAIPLATPWHTIQFDADSYWGGETHRLSDRPAVLIRLVDELIELGAQQIVLVSAAPDDRSPHALAAPRSGWRQRLGEYLQSSEAAIVRDATTTTGGVRIFTIRPVHNPIGPLDFDGGYDDGSQRLQPLTELLGKGYQDAYSQFIEPVVGASGERLAGRTERA